MSETPSVTWETALRDAYLQGRANVFLLHGAVSDFQWHPGGGFISLWDAVAELLGRSRSFVVSVDGAGDGTISHAETPAVVRAALAWARPGTRDASDVMAGGSIVLLPALGRLLSAPAHPCGVVVHQAELLLGQSMDLSTRVAVAKVRRWLDEPRIRDTNNVAVLVVDDIESLSPLLARHPRLFPICIGLPTPAVRVAALRGELGDRVIDISDARLTLATHEQSLADVASLCSRLASVSVESIAKHFPNTSDEPDGDLPVSAEPALESTDV